MSSPFPGMNPYLEQDSLWQNFHQLFATTILQALVPQVRPAYIVTLEEHVYIHELSDDERLFLGRADVALTQVSTAEKTQAGATALQAPARGRIPAVVDIERLSYVEIRDRQDRQLVAVLELLSPSNKKIGPDREQYVAKRRRLLSGSAHFVEIDLLRGGPRMPLEDLPDCDYYALVSRVEERPDVAVWPIRLRDRLPKIPVPLRAPDPHVWIDLQQLLDRVYDSAGYADYIYTGHPQPPLHPDDAVWARQFLPPML